MLGRCVLVVAAALCLSACASRTPANDAARTNVPTTATVPRPTHHSAFVGARSPKQAGLSMDGRDSGFVCPGIRYMSAFVLDAPGHRSATVSRRRDAWIVTVRHGDREVSSWDVRRRGGGFCVVREVDDPSRAGPTGPSPEPPTTTTTYPPTSR